MTSFDDKLQKTKQVSHDNLVDEYKNMLDSAENQGNAVKIVTKEGKAHYVEFTPQGWVLLDDNDHRTFETSEALLMAISGQFENKWSEALTNRLKSVEKERRNKGDDKTKAK